MGVASVRRAAGFEVADHSPVVDAVGPIARGEVYQDGRHYVLRGWSPLHLISGSDHILVSVEFFDVLQRHCGESVGRKTVSVQDQQTGSPVTGYVELQTPWAISQDSLLRAESEGGHAWHFMKRHLFVSERAAAEIDRSRILGLGFAPGFSDFLGANAGGECAAPRS
jgi:hypothetical protein